MLYIVSSFIRNVWHLKLSFLVFCQLAVVISRLTDVGTSDLQHASGSSVHLWLISAVLLHDPVGVWAALSHNGGWFPRCILPVLDPDCHTWSQLYVVPLWSTWLSPEDLLVSFIHLLGS